MRQHKKFTRRSKAKEGSKLTLTFIRRIRHKAEEADSLSSPGCKASRLTLKVS